MASPEILCKFYNSVFHDNVLFRVINKIGWGISIITEKIAFSAYWLKLFVLCYKKVKVKVSPMYDSVRWGSAR